MTSVFFRNLYFGTKFTDEELENVPHPRFELHYHVLYKTTQAGGILGLCVLGPLVGLIRGRGNMTMVKNMSMMGGQIGVALGIPLAPLMTEMRLRGKDETPERLYDRSYRIRYNTTQLRCDRWATIGEVAGLAGGWFMGGTLMMLLNGAIIGFTAGTITAAVYNAKLAHDEIRKAPKRINKGESKEE